MGMAEDIAQIRFQIDQMGSTDDLFHSLENIKDRLQYQIEPKLDQVLQGKVGAEPAKPQLPPDEMLRLIRATILYATTNQEVNAIVALRKATNAGLKEAKDTVELIQQYVDRTVTQQKEAES